MTISFRRTLPILFALSVLASSAHAQVTTFTDRAAWEAAVAAAGATAQDYDFTGLTTGRVTQTDTNYGPFRIVIDRVSPNTFSNPGIDVFPDASCSLGTGDCEVFTFNIEDVTTILNGPRFNKLVMPEPIVAFGGDFIQLGVTAASTTPIGTITLHFGPDTIVVNNFVPASAFGNGFFGFVADVPVDTIEFTFTKSGSLLNDIFQVYNPAFANSPDPGAAPAYGTAVRVIRRDPLGVPEGVGQIAGDVGVLATRRYTGSTTGGGTAAQGALESGVMSAGAWSSAFTGTSRGIAFRSFRNTTADPLTLRVNTVLDGRFRETPFGLPNGFLRLGGMVRVFDAAIFSQTIEDSGMTASDFMLSGYTLQEALDIEQRFHDLGQLFPGASMASGSTFYENGPFNVPLTANVQTNTFTVPAGETFTVFFDVITTSIAQIFGGATGVGTVDFLHTLGQAADFFTDAAGVPVAGIEALGPAPAPDAPVTTLTLTPGTATNQLDTDHTVTVTVTDSNSAPVPEAIVQFEVLTGPNAGQAGAGLTDAAGQTTFTYTGSQGVGTDEIQASIDALLSNVVTKTWDPPGVLDHIAITPGTPSIAAGQTQAFTVEAFDRFNFSRGDVTASTTFAITPNGSCTLAVCTATLPGAHTVTATHNGKTATAALTVEAGPVERITIAPLAITIAPGGSQAYTTLAFDQFNNSLGNVTGSTSFGVTPEGSCLGATCTAAAPGAHTVTGTYLGKTAEATLNVSTPSSCSIVPKPATLAQPYLGLPYVQILSATPSGTYTFRVVSGALPPGVSLVKVLGVTSLVGIPTTPGTYTFTIGAKKNNQGCEGTATYTVVVQGTVVPTLRCVVRNPNRTYTAQFGYDNTTGQVVTIPVGSSNYFTPGAQNRGQVTVFQPGKVANAFSVTFNTSGNNVAVWLVRGPDGALRLVNVSTATLGCS